MIDFGYSARTPETVYKINPPSNSTTPDYLSSVQRLSSITISNGVEVLKSCTLRHSYPQKGDNPVLFLTGVDISGEGTYAMDYYDMNSNFPSHATSHIDHWGYFNNPSTPSVTIPNRYDMGAILPQVEIDSKNVETIKSSSRNPNFYGSRRGMLKKMVYPTKGYSRFYYESHSYTRMLTRDLSQGNRPYLKRLDTEQIAGGVRIRKITNYTTDSDSTYKEYFYNLPVSKNFSGILLHFPRYSIIPPGSTKVLKRPANLLAYSIDKSHIEYESVIERFSDGSAKDYYYSTYRSMPDLAFDNNLCNYWPFVDNPDDRYQISWGSFSDVNFFAEMDSRAAQRGKLLSSTTADKNGRVVSTSYADYDLNQPLSYHPTIKKADYTNTWYISKIFMDDYKPYRTREEMFSQAGNYTVTTSITDYQYNERGQIVKTSSVDKSDSTVYLIDLPLMRSSYAQLVAMNLNIKNLPSSKITKVKKNGKNYIINELLYFYEVYNGVPYLAAIDRYNISSPVISTQTRERIVEYTRDDLGRIIEQIDYPDTYFANATVYIWGYNGLYPVAKITGLRLADIMGVAGLSDINNTPLSGDLSDAQYKSLRALPFALVTRYKYKPFIGLSESWDPSGNKTTYEYNSTGKLIKVTDHNNNILEQYEYSTDKL